jgi:5-methylcytosine-specific restriction endonuclease McrA
MALWRAAGGRCGICQEPVDPSEMEIDHIAPYSRTGRTNFHELQAVHGRCNRLKGCRP